MKLIFLRCALYGSVLEQYMADLAGNEEAYHLAKSDHAKWQNELDLHEFDLRHGPLLG